MKTSFLHHAVVVVSLLMLLAWQRIPLLHEQSMNIDESQYQAVASFLVTTGESTFNHTYFPAFQVFIYRWLAEFFGVYNVESVRVFFLLIAWLHSALVYHLALRIMPTVYAAGAAVLSIILAWWYEGLTANCEWPSSTAILLSFSFYVASRQHANGKSVSRWWLLASGAAAAWSFAFKYQASFLLVAIPISIISQSIAERSLRTAKSALVWYILGGILGTCVTVLPVLIFGDVAHYLGQFSDFFYDYAVSNAAESTRQLNGSLWAFLWIIADSFFLCRPGGTLHLLAFLTCIFILARSGISIFLGNADVRQSEQSHTEELLLGWYILAAMACVQLGWRWFAHYFLFVEPAFAMGALWGLRQCFLKLPRSQSRIWWFVSFAPVATIIIEYARSLAISESSEKTAMVVLFVSAYSLAGILALAIWKWTPNAQWAFFAPSLLLYVCAFGRIAIDPLTKEPQFNRLSQGISDIAGYMMARHAPGDRLFVWGWRPEIYTACKLPAASRFGSCAYIVRDFSVDSKTDIRAIPNQFLLDDLGSTEPRWIVNADRITHSLAEDANIYAVFKYKELESLLQSKYVEAESIGGCTIYVRKSELVQ